MRPVCAACYNRVRASKFQSFSDHFNQTMTWSFRFLDDIAVADIAFEAQGNTVEELFSGATRALIETLADPGTIGAVWQREIHRSESDLSALLFDWLSDIVYWKDAEGVVFHDAPLTVTSEAGHWTLNARLIGAPVNRAAQELRNDVKGVTKHLYEVNQEAERWQARVVLDV
ncbi:archease [Nitrospira sp. KM1]|uniref:archease n=1 Tax=Nitrospira sp. KM1 TaxID=1936990 RepID=UPI0013A74207|nr:archease [Nitrospira sp. KM1]BCA54022.1 archease [Nitrospira sp. KM1]